MFWILARELIFCIFVNETDNNFSKSVSKDHRNHLNPEGGRVALSSNRLLASPRSPKSGVASLAKVAEIRWHVSEMRSLYFARTFHFGEMITFRAT